MHCARAGQVSAARAHFRASERAAQKFDSPKLRASMLSGRIHMLDSPHLRKRWLEATLEYVELARELGDRPMLANALKHRYMGLLEFGDTRAMRQVLRSYVKLAEQLYMPNTLFYRHAFEGCRHWIEGRFDAAERSFDRALEFLTQGGAEARFAMLWRGPLLRERGQLRRVLSGFSELASYDPVVSASIALELCESGAEDQARRSLHQIRDRGLDAIPAGSTWLVTLSVLAELSAQLADPTVTPLLIETLTPFAHCNAAGYGVSCIGPISYFLARLHTALGDWKEAERAFEHAERRSRELRSPVFVTQSRLGRVDLLLLRAVPGDRAHARDLLVKISATARAVGMQRVVDRAAALRASL
jgi:tetratricopeptide (TPR) repeat protein